MRDIPVLDLDACLAHFLAYTASHDADLAARQIAQPDVSKTLDHVAVLRVWLQRYVGALQRRR
jgi:hypothetical protein